MLWRVHSSAWIQLMGTLLNSLLYVKIWKGFVYIYIYISLIFLTTCLQDSSCSSSQISSFLSNPVILYKSSVPFRITVTLHGPFLSVIFTAVSSRLLSHAAVYLNEAWFPDWVMDVCEYSRTECHGLSLIFPITKHSASTEKHDESPSAATSLYMKDGAVLCKLHGSSWAIGLSSIKVILHLLPIPWKLSQFSCLAFQH